MQVLERNNSLAQRVTRELGRAILCGEYKPNHSLPTEAKLCENFGVSRTAVREAVKMLSAKGLITSKPRQGIKVQPEIEWNLLDSELLEWSLESNPSMNVLKEYLQMRIAIEPEAAALAARSYGPEWFLPSLNEFYSILDALPTLESVPGFSSFTKEYIYYWSSTEYDSNRAWVVPLNFDLIIGDKLSNKNVALHVRAVRAF